MRAYRILFVGLGNLGAQIFDQLVRVRGRLTFLVGGRNLHYLRERTNLSLLSASQLGRSPRVSCTALDLWNKEQTAEVISQFEPDLIVCAATLQQTEAIAALPPPIARKLATVGLGPRLPLHLALVSNLMQSVQMTGRSITVLNAVYPDVVGPVLHKVGLAPTTGVGDLANNVPALRYALSEHLCQPVERIALRLVMARYASYWLSRRSIREAPYHMSTLLDEQEYKEPIKEERVFELVRTTYKRTEGPTGLLMTAASAAVVFDGIVSNTSVVTHAPGPGGLPGGYPVRVDEEGVHLVLPGSVSLQEALQINEAGLRLDGIERIEEDGTVCFNESQMAILAEVLGYSCQRMPLCDVGECARELQTKFLALAKKATSSSSL